jgi:regulator of sigma E protease
MTFVFQIIIGIFVLGILVIIHELGHFIVAKACGVRVLSFSIGFGKVLYRKTVNGTEYRISTIPFGGYVHMKGEHPEDEHEQSNDDFTAKPIWQRAAVAIAGPAANVVSSIIFLWILFMVGIQERVTLNAPLIGSVAEDSPAFEAGLQPGDSIITINNASIQLWDKIKYHFTLHEKSYDVSFYRNGVVKEVTIKMYYDEDQGMPRFLFAGLEPVYPPIIGEVSPGSQAQKSGLHSGDRILEINKIKIHTWSQIPEIITSFDSTKGPMEFIIQRMDSKTTILASPSYNNRYKKFLLGILQSTEKVRYGIIEAVPKALEKSWEYTTMIFRILPKIFSLRKQLAGPVGIMHMSGRMALISIVGLLNLMALIGINLGVLNLFPLIITDGGVLFFLMIESVRRKPLSLKTQLLLNRMAIAFFITLFLLVTFNDIERILRLFNIFSK